MGGGNPIKKAADAVKEGLDTVAGGAKDALDFGTELTKTMAYDLPSKALRETGRAADVLSGKKRERKEAEARAVMAEQEKQRDAKLKKAAERKQLEDQREDQTQSRQRQRRRQRMASEGTGRRSTILTEGNALGSSGSGQGRGKTLLGL